MACRVQRSERSMEMQTFVESVSWTWQRPVPGHKESGLQDGEHLIHISQRCSQRMESRLDKNGTGHSVGIRAQLRNPRHV